MALRSVLESNTLGSVFTEPRYVIYFDHNTTIGEALETLSRHQILSAPVVVRPDVPQVATSHNPLGKPLVKALIGFVSVGDFLQLYLQVLDERCPGGSWSEADLEEVGTQLCSRPVLQLFGDGAIASPNCMLASNSDSGRDWGLKGNVGESLLNVIRRGFLTPQNAVAPLSVMQRVVHRLAVFDCSEDPLDGPPHLLGIFSQMDAVRFLAQHLDALGPLAYRTLEELNLVGTSVRLPVAVPHHLPTVQACKVLYDQKVSAVAVVGPDGALQANLSVSDLRCLAPGLFSALRLPVADYLSHRPLLAEVQQEMSFQAMNVDESSSEPGRRQPDMEGPLGVPQALRNEELPRNGGVITCNPGSSFSEVVVLAAKHSVHRVWVVDQGSMPLAAVTLTDMLRVVSDACNE